VNLHHANPHLQMAIRKLDEAGEAYKAALEGVELSRKKANAIEAAELTLNNARWNLLCLREDAKT
jgi:hypothetical protein